MTKKKNAKNARVNVRKSRAAKVTQYQITHNLEMGISLQVTINF